MHTVVIFDVLHKVLELSEIYQNDIAKDIINKIDIYRKENPYNPKWEEYLIYRVTKKFYNKEKNFIKDIEYINGKNKKTNEENIQVLQLFDEFGLRKIHSLKSDRNLCAHPTNDANRELRIFTQEDARLHIRNMFEYVFLKDSFYIADFINLLDSDILERSKIYDVNIEGCVKNNSIELYFKNNYFKNSDKIQKKFIIKYLMKNIIKEDYYRKEFLIFKLLVIIIDDNIELSKDIFMEREFISKLLNKISFPEVKESYYTDIMNTYPTSLNNALSRIIMLFFLHPNLYLLIDDIFKDKLRIECEKNFKYYFLADFLNNDLGEHLKNTEDIRNQTKRSNSIKEDYDVEIMLCLYYKYKEDNVFNEFLFKTLLKSHSFPQSISILESLFPVIINDFTRDKCIKLLELFNSNYYYYRLECNDLHKYGHSNLRDYLTPFKGILFNKLGDDFDYSKFENLKCF